MSTSDSNILSRLDDDPFAGARMFALICDECGEDGGHESGCPGRIALGIDDGRGHATTLSGGDGQPPTFTRHEDAECAEAFYDLTWPVRLVWAGGNTAA